MKRAQKSTVYHLADGIVLSLGPYATWLFDVQQKRELKIDYRFIEPLEKVCMGADAAGYEEYVPRLMEEGWLATGPADIDPVLRRYLARLDRVFLREYEHTLSDRARAAYELLLDNHARRKRFFERVGQCPVLPETALRRALLVGDADVVGAKDVLCVGDDDMVSIALAALGHRVVVFDIDDFLLRFLQERRDAHDLAIEVVARDLRDPLDDVTQRFDVFMTDPMSNRDCFEIFLSRAFALLRPDGVGYCAVYAPVTRLFEQVAAQMGFSIERWLARHNRYYSRHMRMHEYRSDWVQLRPTPQLALKHAPDEYSVPLNLYREDYYQHERTLLLFVDAIENVRYALPLFLETLVDSFASLTGVTLSARRTHAADDWSLVHATTPDGHLTLQVDRRRRQITVSLHPFGPETEQPLQDLLLNAYKSALSDSSVAVSRAAWDIRVR